MMDMEEDETSTTKSEDVEEELPDIIESPAPDSIVNSSDGRRSIENDEELPDIDESLETPTLTNSSEQETAGLTNENDDEDLPSLPDTNSPPDLNATNSTFEDVVANVNEEESANDANSEVVATSSNNVNDGRKATVRSFRTRLDENGELCFEFDSDEQEESSDSEVHLLDFVSSSNIETRMEIPQATNNLFPYDDDEDSDEDPDYLYPRNVLQHLPTYSDSNDEDQNDFEEEHMPSTSTAIGNRVRERRGRPPTVPVSVTVPVVGSRRKQKKPKRKKVAKKKVPKQVKPRVKKPPKPLAPKVIYEDLSGNECFETYKDKIMSETKHKLTINFSDAPFSNKKNNNNTAYKIGEIFLRDVGMKSWTVQNQHELLKQFQGLSEFCLYISDMPTLSVIRLKTIEQLSEEESALRPKPLKLCGKDLKRKLLFVLQRYYFFHFDPVGIDATLFSYQGLGSKKTFRLDFIRFDESTKLLQFDVKLLSSAILGKHDLSTISYGRNENHLSIVFNHFFSPESLPHSVGTVLKPEAQGKEDIAWFYGQIKKYHSQETLPEPEFSLQPDCVIPILRTYQKNAVKWMLYRENVLKNKLAQPSTSKTTHFDLTESFYKKMYQPVTLELYEDNEDDKKCSRTLDAYYNAQCGYVCWSKPEIAPFCGGGLLADEMGLGKTVEVICLILLNQRPELKAEGNIEVLELKSKDSNLDDNFSEDDCPKPRKSLPIKNKKAKRKAYRISSESENEEDPDWIKEESNDSEKKVMPTKTRGRSHNQEKEGSNNSVALRHPRLRRRKMSPCEFRAHNFEEEALKNDQHKQNKELEVQSESDKNVKLSRKLKSQESKVEVKSSGSPKKKRKPSVDKPQTTYDRVKEIYDAVLRGYSATAANNTPRFHGTFFETNVGRKAYFECICGGYNDDNRKILTCHVCGSSQHADCVGFDRKLELHMSCQNQGYQCPHCAVNEEPFPAKTTLIITPNTISHQWISEIQRHVKNCTLSILLYKGVGVHGYMPPARLAEYDIVITTYGVLSTELNYVDIPHNNSEEGRRFRNSKRYLSIPSPLPGVLWWRVCLDEAQLVEGINTKMSMMAMRLQSVYRWGITGTPINEGLQDLFGLFAFLGVQPISYDYWWNTLIRDPFYLKDSSLLYEVFGQLIWRTGKPEVLDQLGIPPQTEMVRWLNFSPVEKHFYRQQYEICSKKILGKIARLRQSSNFNLDTKLSSLDRQTLQALLLPFLELRQACCHPQMVKGQLISLQKGTLTMQELLAQLIKKTSIQCAEDHRLVVSSWNGMAGIHIIKEEWLEASERYREVLQSADKNKEHFPTDSLQLLHTIENLADLLDRHHDGLPYTLRDDKLRSESEELKDKYLKKYADGVKAAKNAVEPLTLETEEMFDKFQCQNQSWWAETLIKAARLDKMDILIQRIKDELIDNTKKTNNLITLANKFNDATGLQHVLIESITQIESMRQKVLQGLQDLQKDDISNFVHAAVCCHLRKKSQLYYKDSDQTGFRCNLCKYHDDFLLYESVIFKEEKKKKTVRTGRKWQQQKIMGPISSDLTEEEKSLALLKEEEELLESLAEVNVGLSNELRRGTWGDSDTEKILKIINNFARMNSLSTEVKNDGSIHLKLFESMKKEFRLLRILWKQIYDQISAVDELSQATTRLRLRYDNEEPTIPQPGTSQSSKNKKPKGLKSGFITEQDERIQNINILESHDIEEKLGQMRMELENANHDLSNHMGKLLYLETLKKNGYGKTGSVNSDDCPICQQQLGMEWSVLRCGHSYCSDCVKKMCPNTLHSFLCPLCRQEMKYADVSFVDTREIEDDRNVKSIKPKKVEIKGSHSTKIEAIIETLIKLQDSHPGEKALIFSTWNDVLEIIAKALDQNDIKNCVLTKPGKAFQTDLNRFKNREDIQVLLMPLSSGSKGLNIIEATHVLLVEPILNIANELQAIGRVHRIGQNKSTYIHRFYIKKTIEEQLHELLRTHDVTSDDEGSLTVFDLQNLIQRDCEHVN